MSDALSRADILITTGGSSMGSSDLLKPVIERYLGGTVHFGRVAVKPGKPTTFATIPSLPLPAPAGEGSSISVKKPMFALPGNPASALVMFYVFVVPALRKLGGWDERSCSLPRVNVQVRGVARSLYAPATLVLNVLLSCADHG
jgi:gephyrin